MNSATMPGNDTDDSAETSTHSDELETERSATGYFRSPVKICLIDRSLALNVKSAELTMGKLGCSFQRSTPSPPVLLGSPLALLGSSFKRSTPSPPGLLGSSLRQPSPPQPVPLVSQPVSPPPRPGLPAQPVLPRPGLQAQPVLLRPVLPAQPVLPRPGLQAQPVPPLPVLPAQPALPLPQSIPVLVNGAVPPPPPNKPKRKPWRKTRKTKKKEAKGELSTCGQPVEIEATAEVASTETHRVLVQNLNSELVDEQLLYYVFGRVGLITAITMNHTQAHIDFATGANALAAVAGMNDTQLATNVIAVSLLEPEVINVPVIACLHDAQLATNVIAVSLLEPEVINVPVIACLHDAQLATNVIAVSLLEPEVINVPVIACLHDAQLATNVIAVSLQQPEVIDLCSEAGSEPQITSPTPSNRSPSPEYVPRHVVLNVNDADTVMNQKIRDQHGDKAEVETSKRKVKLSKKFQNARLRAVFGTGALACRNGKILKKRNNATPQTLKTSGTSKFKAWIARAKVRFKTLKRRKVATAPKSTGLFLPSTRRLVRLRTAPRKIKPAAAKKISKAVLEERKLIEKSGHRTCCHCQRQFKQAESLISHCHSTGHVVPCDSCSERFSTPIGYWGHWREVHGSAPIYVCELCDRSSGRGHSLGMAIRHFTSLHLPSLDPANPREYRCPLCDHVAHTPNALGYHSTQCHNDRGDHVNRVCPRCGVRKRSVYTARMCYVRHFATNKKRRMK